MDNEQFIFPEHIAVIGGGRWARVLTEVLCEIVLPKIKITVYTKHNKNKMSVWSDSNDLTQRVEVTSSWPRFDKSEVNAAIVVNAARDHEMAIEKLLSEYISVLVEKPVTLTEKATQRLISLAEKNNTYFAAAHIFSFTSYIDDFLKLVTSKDEIKELKIIWTDPGSENRYGERKKYDPGLPIIMDWYPHILSILNRVCSEYTSSCNSIEFDRGGASLGIDMTLGKTPCLLKVKRNSEKRQRIFSIKTVNHMYSLDFSIEPGFITIDNESKNLYDDEFWRNQSRPSSLMLKSFLHGVTSKSYDNRIDIHKGLFANKVVEQAMLIYRKKQTEWLCSSEKTWLENDDSLYYAVAEVFQVVRLISNVELEDKFRKIKHYLSESAGNKDVIQSLLESGSPAEYLDKLIKEMT